ncbi:MAG: hypothetical protein ACKVS9_14850, partial [Phycisphaerae bacterium]
MAILTYSIFVLAWILAIRLTLRTARMWLRFYRLRWISSLLMLSGTLILAGVGAWAFLDVGPVVTLWNVGTLRSPHPPRAYREFHASQLIAIFAAPCITVSTIQFLRSRWAKREAVPLCATCGYRLEGVSAELPTVRCSECGRQQRTDHVLREQRMEQASIDAARDLRAFLRSRRGKRHVGFDVEQE